MHHPLVHFIIPEGPRRGTVTVYRPVLPRGVLQVAGAAQAAGWEATVLDAYSAPHLLEAYLQALAQRGSGAHEGFVLPDLVGIAVHGPPAIEPGLGIAARLREIEPTLPLLFGGQLANSDAELLLPLLPDRSTLFCGDGDAAIAGVLKEALKATGKARLIRHPGLHPWHSLPDLDLLLPEYAEYFGEADFEYHLETQIGCPYRCFHCGTGRKGLYAKTMNRPIEAIQRELDQVVAWMRQANLPYPPRLWITDETFGSDTEHSRAFCEALISRPEPWQWRAQSRADAISERLLETMREAGCQRLAFGVEIPSDVGLDLLGKREAMKAIEEAFALCHNHGVSPEAIIVVGTPGDTTRPEEFWDALDALGAESVQAYIYHPIPGSPWWKKYGSIFREGANPLRRWADLDFHSPPLSASSCDVERAVVTFLALQLWRPKSAREPFSLSATNDRRGECTMCGQATSTELVFGHGQIEIRKCSIGDKKYYIATTPRSTHVLGFVPMQRSNLFCDLFSIGQKVGETLCPACLIAQDTGNNASVSFQAI